MPSDFSGVQIRGDQETLLWEGSELILDERSSRPTGIRSCKVRFITFYCSLFRNHDNNRGNATPSPALPTNQLGTDLKPTLV